MLMDVREELDKDKFISEEELFFTYTCPCTEGSYRIVSESRRELGEQNIQRFIKLHRKMFNKKIGIFETEDDNIPKDKLDIISEMYDFLKSKNKIGGFICDCSNNRYIINVYINDADIDEFKNSKKDIMNLYDTYTMMITPSPLDSILYKNKTNEEKLDDIFRKLDGDVSMVEDNRHSTAYNIYAILSNVYMKLYKTGKVKFETVNKFPSIFIRFKLEDILKYITKLNTSIFMEIYDVHTNGGTIIVKMKKDIKYSCCMPGYDKLRVLDVFTRNEEDKPKWYLDNYIEPSYIDKNSKPYNVLFSNEEIVSFSAYAFEKYFTKM